MKFRRCCPRVTKTLGLGAIWAGNSAGGEETLRSPQTGLPPGLEFCPETGQKSHVWSTLHPKAGQEGNRGGQVNLTTGKIWPTLNFYGCKAKTTAPGSRSSPFFTQNLGWSTLQKKCKLVLKQMVMSSAQPEKAVPCLSSCTAGTSLLVRQYLPA